MISATTGVAAVIGHPVAHSLSPTLHNAAFESLGLDWVYVAFDVQPGGAGAALAAMRALGVRGLSVTMPHKEPVARHLAEHGRLAPSAAALDSVNTVVTGADGVLEGHTTDGDGLVASLRAAGADPTGASVCLLGAGAAARAIADALARCGVGRIAVRNRSSSAAEQAAAIARAAGARAVAVSPDDRPSVATADIVVNATSVGMGIDPGGGLDVADPAVREALAVDPELLGPQQVVVDIVYHPRRTVLLRLAETAGARTLDGLGMLVHQAALQQVLWHGQMPDVSLMADAAERALAARGPA